MSGYYNRNNRGITKKLGPVTAYADAVLAGYTGTREQWAQDMAKLGQNVTQVAQNTKLTTELAEQTRVNTEQVAKDTADVRVLAEETSDNAAQVASNTAESNRLAEETKQAAAQAKDDAEYAGAAADNFRVDTTLSEEGKAAEAKTTGEKFEQLSEENQAGLNNSVITSAIVPFWGASADAEADDRYLATRVGVSRRVGTVVLNGSTMGGIVRVTLSGDLARTATNSDFTALERTVDLIEGHQYEITVKQLSGSYTGEDIVCIVYSDGVTAMGSAALDKNTGIGTAQFTWGGGLGIVALRLAKDLTYDNLELCCVITDLTETKNRVFYNGKVYGMTELLPRYMEYPSNMLPSIPENSDFNDYRTPGSWRVNAIAIMETIANRPCDVSGRLFVVSLISADRLMQIYMPLNNFGFYQRYYYGVRDDGAPKFTTWEKAALFSDLPKTNNLRVDPLHSAKVCCDGDSICAGYKDLPSEKGAWFGRLVEKYQITGKNYAVSGGTITSGVEYDDVTMRHSVCDTIDTIYAENPDLDYLILEGGVNDADKIGRIVSGTTPERFGTVTEDDFGGNYDKTTFCGAAEHMFYKALTLFPHAKIGFIIAQEMGSTNTAGLTVKNRRAYFDKIKEIAEKWHIPVLDLWQVSGLDARLTSCFDPILSGDENVTAGKMYYDTQHPTSCGYDRMQDKIEAWMRTL